MLRALHSDLATGSAITLSPEESHHLVRVRRASAGAKIELLDGQGGRALALLKDAHAKRAQLEITEFAQVSPSSSPVLLFQALPKGKTMDGIVQRATELGVAEIHPLLTDHSEVQLDERRQEQKVAKWNQLTEEAIKQCGNPWRPRLFPPTSLRDALERLNSDTRGLVASLRPPTMTIRSSLQSVDPNHSIAIAIGPEGDFSEREYEAMARGGWTSVTLGPLVLRAETASCAMLALVLNERREQVQP